MRPCPVAPHRLVDGAPRRTPTRLGSLLVAGAASTALVLVFGLVPPAGARSPAIRPAVQVPPPAPSPTPTTLPGEEGNEDEPAELPPLGPLPELAPALDGVEVHSRKYDAAIDLYEGLKDERDDAVRLGVVKAEEVYVLTLRERDLTGQINRARARAEYWEDRADRLSREIRDMAVEAYAGGSGAGLDPLLTMNASEQRDRATEDVTVAALTERHARDMRRARRNGRRKRTEQRVATALRQGVREGIVDAQAIRDRAAGERDRVSLEMLDAAETIKDERRLAMVEGADFPLVVLDAYWKAARLMEYLAPDCGIPWWALTGIGKTESRHGTFGGAEVRPDGSLTKPIVGIPLNGWGGTAAIGDSDGGIIDGDPTVDRAAGPMQFIPQTWTRWGRDGDQNGQIEIQNLYDGAASAAAYLCASGSLLDDSGLQRAYFSYNHSLIYVAVVLARSKQYAEDIQITPDE